MNITTERIREVMGGMTQTRFAESIKSSQPVISKILNGEPPSSNVLIEISKKYKVSIDWLLGLSSEKNLAGYMKYKEKSFTYADVISTLVRLIQYNSCEFIEKKESSGEMGDFYRDEITKDVIYLNDHFIGDVLSSVSALGKTNPETVDNWINGICENYNIPILEWTNHLEMNYMSCKPFMSSLEILKQYYDSIEGK